MTVKNWRIGLIFIRRKSGRSQSSAKELWSQIIQGLFHKHSIAQINIFQPPIFFWCLENEYTRRGTNAKRSSPNSSTIRPSRSVLINFRALWSPKLMQRTSFAANLMEQRYLRRSTTWKSPIKRKRAKKDNKDYEEAGRWWASWGSICS